jgi:3',5'-cyclic-AMP phosphodiesterase
MSDSADKDTGKATGTATRPVVLMQMTDTHLHAAADSRMRGVTTYQTFLDVLAKAEQDRHWPPDALLVTGDIVQDESRAGYERFHATLAHYGLPVLCLPGNHDDPKLMEELLAQAPFQCGGAASFGRWSVILLNTFLMGEDAGGLGAQRLRALRQALKDHANQHVLIALHHQPVPMGSVWLDGVGLRDAPEFLRIVEEHPQVRCVLWGHVHQASDRTIGQVRFISTPSTCSQFLPRSDFFALDDKPPGMRWLELHADGHIETRVVWANSAVPQRTPR